MYLEVKCKVQTKSLFSLNRKYSPLPIGKYSGRNVWCTSAKLPNLATQQSEKVEQKHLVNLQHCLFFFLRTVVSLVLAVGSHDAILAFYGQFLDMNVSQRQFILHL